MATTATVARKFVLDELVSNVSPVGSFGDFLLDTDSVRFSNLGTSRRLHLRIESEQGDVFGLTLTEALSDKVKELLSGGDSDTVIISNLIARGQVIETNDGIKFLTASQLGQAVKVASLEHFEELSF